MAAVRFDAGYPGEALPSALEARGTHYVARRRENAVLDGLALTAIGALACEALAGGPPDGDESGTWTCELDGPYRPRSWSRARRTLHVVERPGELFPLSFRLPAAPSADALGARRGRRPHGEARERRRPGAVGLATPQAPPPRSVETPGPSVDAFACNQTLPPLAVFGHQIMLAQHTVLERANGSGFRKHPLTSRNGRASLRSTPANPRLMNNAG